MCRQTSILPERGVAALQNNFFITNLMEVLQRQPDGPHPARGGDPLSAVTGQPLCCPNHEGKVRWGGRCGGWGVQGAAGICVGCKSLGELQGSGGVQVNWGPVVLGVLVALEGPVVLRGPAGTGRSWGSQWHWRVPWSGGS